MQPCKSILVIEDDHDIRNLVAEILQMENYDVYTAENGKEAIAQLHDLPQPPLILLDMMMPVMNGWEFLEAQKTNAQFASIPVVVVSALSESHALVNDQGLVNAEGLLRKPIDIGNLLKIVETYCAPPEMRSSVESTAPPEDVRRFGT